MLFRSVIGLASSGAHSNGYSLVRKILDRAKVDLAADFHGRPFADVLIEPTRIYVKPLLALMRAMPVKGMAHITGGGITDNLPRVLPPGTAARVNRTSWRVPAIFRWLGEAGRVPEYDLRRALNMGIGMVLVVAAKDVDAVKRDLLNAGEANSVVIGDIVKGEPGVQYV